MIQIKKKSDIWNEQNGKNQKTSLNTALNTVQTRFVTKKFILLKKLKKTRKKWKKVVKLDEKRKIFIDKIKIKSDIWTKKNGKNQKISLNTLQTQAKLIL